ncbi:protein of unknown function [Taphrina deformans PYCC 5710]|uniref:Uncharacterized protein n=1 Tax=Taphrina deformans (strain PYCC 5710 / ATCC 11124 / CBS 356.35 / IMI 108563 / JCM 9778 / NBRC 8474) TaxID=1097556 RepID=R4XE13_TAPDE|nr:protein of unknown function [Taphrina deformans PYCC 5710]|eukprot:CCG84060.1 protein of unknown function [Taphrina deformans PYCC 5710]
MAHESLKDVKNILLILSGKGGVGKSSITTQLALSLALQGKKVGVLDIDLTGPSIPRFFGIEGRQVHQASGGWIPVYLDAPADNSAGGSVCCMSIGFLLKDRGDSVVWRGPKKTAMIRQFLTDVVWGQLDYLLIDTPPGTSDEHISVVEKLRDFERVRGAVLVTTPQEVSTADVRKELSFCGKVGIKVLGVVENMSGYVCPCCNEITNIFSSGGGEAMAKQFSVPFLGKVPIEPKFVEMIEEQQKEGSQSLLGRYPDSSLYTLFSGIAAGLIETIDREQMPNNVAALKT